MDEAKELENLNKQLAEVTKAEKKQGSGQNENVKLPF